jgi:hypothetical protein
MDELLELLVVVSAIGMLVWFLGWTPRRLRELREHRLKLPASPDDPPRDAPHVESAPHP